MPNIKVSYNSWSIIEVRRKYAIISLIFLQNENVNSKAHEVNSRPINMCVKCDIIFNAQTDVIDFVRHSYDGKIDLNNPLTKELAKNVCEFLL